MYNEVLKKKRYKNEFFKKLCTSYILHTVMWSNINAYFSLVNGAACETKEDRKYPHVAIATIMDEAYHYVFKSHLVLSFSKSYTPFVRKM